MAETKLVSAIEELSYDEMLGFAFEIGDYLGINGMQTSTGFLGASEIAEAIRAYARKAREEGVQ